MNSSEIYKLKGGGTYSKKKLKKKEKVTGKFFDFSTNSFNVFSPTFVPIFQAVNMWPWLNISSTPSNDRPTVSGYMKQTWRNAAKLKDPKIK